MALSRACFALFRLGPPRWGCEHEVSSPAHMQGHSPRFAPLYSVLSWSSRMGGPRENKGHRVRIVVWTAPRVDTADATHRDSRVAAR